MRWTKDEIQILLNTYQFSNNKEISVLLACSRDRVAKKLNRMGLKRDYRVLYPDLHNEIWKDFPKNTAFVVSNKGRIRRKCNGYLLKPYYNKSGYYYVDLGDKTWLAHRIIALAWVENDDPVKLIEVNHKSGDKNDLSPENLEWCTSSENMRHAYDTGLAVGLGGELNGCSKLTLEQVHYIRSNLGNTDSVLAEKLNVVRKTIYNVRNNKTYLDFVYYP